MYSRRRKIIIVIIVIINASNGSFVLSFIIYREHIPYFLFFCTHIGPPLSNGLAPPPSVDN